MSNKLYSIRSSTPETLLCNSFPRKPDTRKHQKYIYFYHNVHTHTQTHTHKYTHINTHTCIPCRQGTFGNASCLPPATPHNVCQDHTLQRAPHRRDVSVTIPTRTRMLALSACLTTMHSIIITPVPLHDSSLLHIYSH